MEYLSIFLIVFTVIGARGFQQKLVAANRYPFMFVVGTCIYIGEGSAIMMISKGTLLHVVFGAFGAGLGVVCAVLLYNKFFKPKGITDVSAKEGLREHGHASTSSRVDPAVERSSN